MEKSLQRKVIFQKTFNTTLPFKAQCANIILNKNVKLINKTFTHGKSMLQIFEYILGQIPQGLLPVVQPHYPLQLLIFLVFLILLRPWLYLQVTLP